MMKIHMKAFFGATAVAVVLFTSTQIASAATIIKLSLGDTGPDLKYVAGELSTVDDLDGSTLGDQNTSIDFLDFLSDLTDIPTFTASYTLNDVMATGPALLFAGNITQPLIGGSFQLYDDLDNLLLDVDLGASIFNSAGGSGSAFSVTNGTIVDGSLQSRILDNSISFSIALTDLATTGGGPLFTPFFPVPFPPPPFLFGTLEDFTADGSKLIAGEVPEPAAALLMVVAGAIGLPLMRRRA